MTAAIAAISAVRSSSSRANTSGCSAMSAAMPAPLVTRSLLLTRCSIVAQFCHVAEHLLRNVGVAPYRRSWRIV
jgi:hypothetical protein